MGIFDLDNSVEAAAPPKSRAKFAEDIPVREATASEMEGQKRASAKPETVTKPAVKAEDFVAKRHGLYTKDNKLGTRTYYADYQQKKEVMRASSSRIRTKHDDRQTVSTVLDLAQERGWTTLRLRGTEDFRREAWVQASVRGMQTQGYKPAETDKQELARRRAALAPVQAEVAKPAQARVPSPQAAWSEVQAAGAKAREADAAKQAQNQGQGQPKQGSRKAAGQGALPVQPTQAQQQAA